MAQSRWPTILASDRLGIKPLYLSDGADALRFASTLPALVAGGGVNTELDPVALNHYLSWHAVVPAPYTVLKGVRNLELGTVMIVTPDGKRTRETYWQADFRRGPERRDWTSEDWAQVVLDIRR